MWLTPVSSNTVNWLSALSTCHSLNMIDEFVTFDYCLVGCMLLLVLHHYTYRDQMKQVMITGYSLACRYPQVLRFCKLIRFTQKFAMVHSEWGRYVILIIGLLKLYLSLHVSKTEQYGTTNRKLHTRFRLALKSMTLDDYKWPGLLAILAKSIAIAIAILGVKSIAILVAILISKSVLQYYCNT